MSETCVKFRRRWRQYQPPLNGATRSKFHCQFFSPIPTGVVAQGSTSEPKPCLCILLATSENRSNSIMNRRERWGREVHREMTITFTDGAGNLAWGYAAGPHLDGQNFQDCFEVGGRSRRTYQVHMRDTYPAPGFPMMQDAITQFRQALGKHNVSTDAAGLERYRWCTSSVQRNIAAVLQPESVEQVQQIVGIANAHQVPLYPISTGNNWGYGSALPVRHDNVVVDLSRMNRIIDVNIELAYAVLEPGVTQGQLHQHLQQHRIPLSLNPTGAGPHCSILGNALERGFGIGPNGDHFLAQCGMEVVLATGEILRTGFGHYAGAKAEYVYKWGLGPYLDGLFTQSNFGIVT